MSGSSGVAAPPRPAPSPARKPPSPFSLPVHTLRLLGRCVLPLVLWFAAGEAVRFALLYGATEVAYGDFRQARLVATITLLTFVVLAALTVVTGMLHTLRGALWEMRARTAEGAEDEPFFTALDRVAPAFAVLYMAWGFQTEDARDLQQMDLFHHFFDMTDAAFFGEKSHVGRSLIDLDWRVSVATMLVAFGLKTLFAKLVERGTGRFYGFAAAFSEFAFVFYGLNATVAIADARSEWVEHRTVVVGTESLWTKAQDAVPVLKTLTDVVNDVWPLFLDSVAIPLAWLTVAMLVFGAYADDTRTMLKGTRFERGIDRLEGSHDLTKRSFERVTGGFQERWVPLVNSLRLVIKGGAPLFGMMCLCYVAVTVGAQYADRAVRTLVGSQVEWAWAYLEPPLAFGRDLLVTVVTMALLAATFDLAATRARLRGEAFTTD
ncbi:hypothetical protein [Nonomuraea roseoviolacea]|uniref:ABC transporter permease n=1 Tax=Nonomuraea roseoviolacea subsp. carminata TaxID=160689 RepID=A0ABT1JXF1_9ACTN|nr:hypothetical protein [Nonomuraea roseoviolacea]MCP2346400.1 hypothetical protein [Nonomuraea roseoviolacea subsp. carminata]